MGTSGGGSGGGGSGGSSRCGGGGGGSGRYGGGSGGSGRYEEGYASYCSSASKPNKRNIAQKVLGKINTAYLTKQLYNTIVTGIIHELMLIAVDIQSNRLWGSTCTRLNIPETSSPADVQDFIWSKCNTNEYDSRICDVARASLLNFFDELCKFDDSVLYGDGKKIFANDFDNGTVENPYFTFLHYLFRNILQREEPKLLDTNSQNGLDTAAVDMANMLIKRFRKRYGGKMQISEDDYFRLSFANDKEEKWLLSAIRG